MATPSHDGTTMDAETLRQLHRALGSNPTLANLPSSARSGYLAALATIDGLASGMPAGNVKDGVPDLMRLVGAAEAEANPPTEVSEGDALQVVLDRDQLRKLADLLRAAQPDDPNPDFRRGFHLALVGVEEVADGMPELYAGTCPNVPGLITTLWKCESIEQVREVLKPLAIDQYVGFGVRDIEQGGES